MAGWIAPSRDRPQRELGADAVAGDQRPRPARVGRKPASTSVSQSGEYGCVGPVLGGAVQRQVGEHDAVAVRELVDDRLPLAVGRGPCECSSASGGPSRPRDRRSARRRGGGTAAASLRADSFPGNLARRGRREASIGRPVRRREDERILSRALASSSTTSGSTARCTWRSCAARTRTRACSGRARRAVIAAADLAGRAVAGARRAAAGPDARRRAASAAGGRRGPLRRPARRGRGRRRRARWPRTLAERVEVDYEPLRRRSSTRARAPSSRAGSSARATSRARSPRAAHVVRTEHVIPRLAATPMETARRARRAATASG